MRFIALIIFLVMFYTASMGRTEGNGFLLNVIYLSMLGLLLLTLFSNNFQIMNNTKLLLAVYLFVFFSGISSIINSDSYILRTSILIGLAFILASILVPMLRININKLIFLAVIVSHIPIVLIPIIQTGINQSPYQGVFYNPNTFGNTVVTLFAAILPIFIMVLQRRIEGVKQPHFLLKIVSLLIILILLVYLVSISSSRTSFISLVTISLTGFFILTYYIYKNKKTLLLLKRGIIYVAVAVIIFTVVWNTTNLSSIVHESIFLKFEEKLAEGDVLDTRGDIWKQTINEATLFGHGSGYFIESFNLGAHNTFIYILGIYGYIPAIIFILLIINFLLVSMKYALKPDISRFKYSPIILSVNFIMLSLGEEMLFKVAMLIMFFSVSDVYAKKYDRQRVGMNSNSKVGKELKAETKIEEVLYS